MPDPFDELVNIMKKLRSPQGCPWDKEQTHESIKKYIVEEVYEFIEAIDEADPVKMEDELGDLLFQILFHSQMAEEKGLFDIKDVIRKSSEKMIRRHPHVFADKKLDRPDQVIEQWDSIKKTEHNHRHRKSILDGIPNHMPSLIRASKAQKKVAKVGFDWSSSDQIVDKIYEELEETKQAIKNGNREHIKEEIGDLFFSVVNLARFLKFDAEELSRKSVDKFVRRFKRIEKQLNDNGKSLEESTLEEMDALWNKNKKDEKLGNM